MFIVQGRGFNTLTPAQRMQATTIMRDMINEAFPTADYGQFRNNIPLPWIVTCETCFMVARQLYVGSMVTLFTASPGENSCTTKCEFLKKLFIIVIFRSPFMMSKCVRMVRPYKRTEGNSFVYLFN